MKKQKIVKALGARDWDDIYRACAQLDKEEIQDEVEGFFARNGEHMESGLALYIADEIFRHIHRIVRVG
jgi:hypothetical protein